MPKLLSPVKKIFQSQLLAGSLVLLVGTTIANFGNYLYHLLMGRMLGPADYGILASLISLAYLVSILSATLSTSLIKWVTAFKAKNDYSSIYKLFRQLTLFFAGFSLLVLLIFILASGSIAAFLKLPTPKLVYLLGFWLPFNLLAFINEGILRSFLRFSFLSFNAVLGVTLKLVFALSLVKMGFSVSGALMAIIIGSLIPYLISFYPLRFIWRYSDGQKKINWSEFSSYSIPVLLAVLGMTSLYSTDIILVKHLFPALEAGLYGAMATMGKIVFFASSTVSAVMFPLISERFEKNKSYRHLLRQAFLLVGAISLGITMIYFLFPKLMIRILYGEAYLSVAPWLGIFAIFICFYSLSSLLINFYLSIKRTSLCWLPLIAAGLQAILIYFKAQTLIQVILICLGVTALLFFSLLLFLRANEKR